MGAFAVFNQNIFFFILNCTSHFPVSTKLIGKYSERNPGFSWGLKIWLILHWFCGILSKVNKTNCVISHAIHDKQYNWNAGVPSYFLLGAFAVFHKNIFFFILTCSPYFQASNKLIRKYSERNFVFSWGSKIWLQFFIVMSFMISNTV